MPNKLLVRNPMLSEFCYDLLYNITDEQKKRLSKPHLFLLKSSIKAKNFCEFSTIDEKIRLLSEMGIDCSLVFFQDKINSVNGLKKVFEKLEESKQAGAVKETTQLKVFVSSDKIVKWLLNTMAESIHHKSYFINLDYNKLAYHYKNWSKRIDTHTQKELLETLESADVVAKTLLHAATSLDYLENIMGVRSLEMKIMLYLYQYRHTYMEKEKIWSYFAGSGTKGKISTSLKRLFMNEYVKKHLNYKISKYTLTPIGIESVNKYMQHILKQQNF